MQHTDAVRLIRRTFENAYDETNLRTLIAELFRGAENKDKVYSGAYIPSAYRDHISSYKYICKYITPDQEELAVLAVNCSKVESLEKARTLQRNFVANYMKERGKDACLVAFYSDEDRSHWRFSFVRIDNSFNFDTLKTQDIITPAKRFSYMVGEKEASHTAQQQLCDLLESNAKEPNLDAIEAAFAVEKVSNQFFEHYKELFLRLVDNINILIQKDHNIQRELIINKNIPSQLFCKKLLGQIVFLYFIQKKGWLGVEKNANWGTGDRHFMRSLFEQARRTGKNYFDDFLEPLFYEGLAKERNKENYFDKLGCRIPFLNGGLFEPIYDWMNTKITLNNDIFSNDNGDGVLDVFDRYNFTVREDEPLEKEVAVDPEMLGKVFENLLEINDRKSKGAFYTPREIVHYMCQQSLIEYLNTKLGGRLALKDIEFLVQYGDVYSELQDKLSSTKTYEQKIPEQLLRVKPFAEEIDDALATVKVFDPAIGSGAFPVGMMHELIRTRQVLLDAGLVKKNTKRTIYEYKRQIIRDCIYGVDIEESAVEIAKLRLWLSLIVDEDNFTSIKPLPNLDYKVVCGNSLKDIHNIFASQMKARLIELQAKQFDSTGQEKAKYTRQINAILSELLKDGAFDLKIYFPHIFDNGGFDIVIANPPYIGEKGNTKIFDEVKKCSLGNYYLGKMDYFYFFFHLALNLAKEHGVISFITTNYYITASGAYKLRTDFKERADILHMVNFNELKIFKSALGQHNMITILQKNTNHKERRNCRVSFTDYDGVADSSLLQQILYGNDTNTLYSVVEQEDIYDGHENYIRLQNGGDNDNLAGVLEKIQNCTSTLGNICNVCQGVVSGCDTVDKNNIKSIQDNVDLGTGIFVLDLQNKQDKNLYDILKKEVPELLKPFYKNSDIDKYTSSIEPKKYLIYTDRNFKDLKQYPSLENHLQRFKKLLSNRREVKNNVIDFYQLQWPRTEHAFTGPKIAVPYRAKSNIFGYNEIDWFCRSDCYVITPKNTSYKLKYILGLLNSKLYYTWLYYRGKRKGNTLELFQKPLSEIPIKYVDNQEDIVKIVDTIIEKKKQRQSTDEEEKLLNNMVYELYKLTPEEIEEVERLYPDNN